MLVVANETLVGDELVDSLRRRAEHGPVRAAVVAPVHHLARVTSSTATRGGRRRLAGSTACSRGCALQASRPTAPCTTRPADGCEGRPRSEEIDEIVVCTHPETRSGWLRRNLLDEIRKAAGDRRSSTSSSDVSGRSGANVLVVANETVLGEPLLDRIRHAPQRAAATFLIVCPQSDPSRGEHPEAERRLRAALSILRSEGLDVHGQIAHPDPFVAAIEAVEDERTDEIIVSTFPGERSGWLRRDLVGRLRAQTGLPVQHVVVEERVEAYA